MEYTEQQLRKFQDDFARRRRNQLLLLVPMLVALIGYVFGDQYLTPSLGIGPDALGIIFFAVIAGGVIFSFFNWRCPACEKYLGRSGIPRHCPHCGVALRPR
jgi:hypothetical protein